MAVVRAAEMVLTAHDLAQVADAFAVGELQSIGGYENALFRSEDGRIVRVTHTSRRSVDLVEAELAFVAHLAAHGVDTVAPIPTTGDELVLELETDAGDHVVAVAMTEAPGAIRRPPEITDENLVAHGELMARMHAAARDFAPPDTARRPAWTDPLFDVGIGTNADAHADLFERYCEIVEHADASPAGGTDLLIHQDVHYGNVFVTDEGRITVFDFDDCAYGTAVHDVAIPIFYFVNGHGGDPVDAARRYVRHFGEGYRRHAELPDGWLADADRFLSHREIEIYWLIANEPPDNPSPGTRRFMRGRRERILEGVPFLGIPLEAALG